MCELFGYPFALMLAIMSLVGETPSIPCSHFWIAPYLRLTESHWHRTLMSVPAVIVFGFSGGTSLSGPLKEQSAKSAALMLRPVMLVALGQLSGFAHCIESVTSLSVVISSQGF
jgi:hypothetical protein